MENASKAFTIKTDEKAMDKIYELEEENDKLDQKVGRQLIQLDWLKKNLKNSWDLTTRVNLVRNLRDSKHSDNMLPTVKDAAKLLDINRTSVYYKGRMISDIELEIMDHIIRFTQTIQHGANVKSSPNYEA